MTAAEEHALREMRTAALLQARENIDAELQRVSGSTGRSLSDAVAGMHEFLGSMRDCGMDLYATAHLKVAKEAKEFADDPTLDEAADVFSAFVGALHERGHGLADLAAAVDAKMAVNRGRTWTVLPDGTFQHVKEAP